MGIREQKDASTDGIGTGELGVCRLDLALLGPFSAGGAGGKALAISAKKNRALLTVLALSPGMAASRERLAGLLWGDSPDEQARSSLRQSLAALRKELGDTNEAILQVKDDTVRLCTTTVAVDVTAFLKAGQADEIEALRQAASLYRGELLSDFGNREEGFEGWLSIERAQLRQEAIRILEKLTWLESGNERLAVAQKLVALDPLREASQRLLMHSLFCLGERGLALKQFDDLKNLLRDELGVEPAAETKQLASQLAEGVAFRPDGTAEPLSAKRGEKPVVAVLPFSNMSGDPEQDYFADGMTEDIITDLSRFSGISVVARNTVFAYKGKTPNVREVCLRHNARAILEGSIRKSGQRVRITAQLTDGASGTHLWADRYDRELTDIFALQDEIAQAIVAQLRIKLLPGEGAAEHAATTKFDAYNCYVKGRHFFHVGTKQALKLARKMFGMAVVLDPSYAKAFAGIALCDARLRSWHGVEISIADMLTAATRALAMDENLAEAQTAYGIATAQDGRLAEAATSFEKAIALDPESYDAHFFYAWYSLANGNVDKSAALYRRATELRPDDFRSPIYLRSVLHALGDEAGAKKFSLLGLERAEKAFRLHPDSPDAVQLGACVLASLGESDRAREWLAHSLAIDPDGMLSKYNSACVHAMLGESDLAIVLLEEWLKQADRPARRWFLIDADLTSLRLHPRYQALQDLAG
jgi:TolB-like protein/Flp pilus assembly protein TadD